MAQTLTSQVSCLLPGPELCSDRPLFTVPTPGSQAPHGLCTHPLTNRATLASRGGSQQGQDGLLQTWTRSLQHVRHHSLLPAPAFRVFSMSQITSSPGSRTGHLLFLLPTPSLLCQAWAQQRRCQSSARESPALFILHPESRRSQGHPPTPGRARKEAAEPIHKAYMWAIERSPPCFPQEGPGS